MSAVFSSVTLTLIGAFNLATVGPQFRAWRRAANKEQREHHHNHNAELIDEGEQVRVEVTGGLFARCGCCKRLLASVDAAWKMYFVGVLFGLGFRDGVGGWTCLGGGRAEGRPRAPGHAPARLIYVGHGFRRHVRRVAGALHLRQGQRRRRRGRAALRRFANGGVGGGVAGHRQHRRPRARGAVPAAARAGPLVALSDALDAHTTAVGLAVVGMFVAALVLSMAAPTLHRVARQRARGALRQDAAAALRGDLHLTAIRFRSVC